MQPPKKHAMPFTNETAMRVLIQCLMPKHQTLFNSLYYFVFAVLTADGDTIVSPPDLVIATSLNLYFVLLLSFLTTNERLEVAFTSLYFLFL